MAEENKKISFGFAKSIKKSILDKQKLHEEKKVDYIECLDEKAIKVIGKEEKKEKPLIIPLLESNTWHDRIINKIDASKSRKNNDNICNVKVKEEPKNVSNGDLISINKVVSSCNVQIKTELSTESKTLILDEQAAKEIIEDLNSIEENKDELCNITLSVVKGQDLKGAEESTLEDYEKVPLSIFGSAMLRGMGWKPGEGIGKNPKLVTPVVPELRPIGMGLGADKIAVKKLDGKIQKEEEELRIQKGSFIKIIAGKRSNAYGQIEGFDDAGRLIVKMALNGNIISVNECIVQVVTKMEYSKNSKVLNAAKYEEHKKKEGSASKRECTSLENFSNKHNSDSDISDRKRKHKENDREHKSKKSSKKSKTQQRDLSDIKSDSDSDSDNKKRNKSRRRSSSNDRAKRAKKSKKHKGRAKERQRDKISGSFESIDRRKFKKHRSRSSSRR
ncbi:PREDICTED: G patch domain and KOW motifs-containing protein [Wasmannia auropunctata]|uniref:G patch domain and KOW motifs-containing protein n=1 Tax=Wasmannia auropunctata TaxID=64793 RepID=UPI0005EFE223|nr:PREDICTED: G patch domain and KOW motifs-containing protein [Wasmannia auropunctata]